MRVGPPEMRCGEQELLAEVLHYKFGAGARGEVREV